jgi:hypothetical protein
MRWRTFEVSSEHPFNCICCDDLVPPEEDSASEWLYVLGGDEDTTDEEINTFEKAFGVDALSDFHICLDCLKTYGAFGGDIDPMHWLENYLEEDAKYISHEEALRRLSEGEV